MRQPRRPLLARPPGQPLVPVEAIGDYLRSKNPDIDGMRLHVLLYYCHGWNLSMPGRPLFRNSVLASADGPMIDGLPLHCDETWMRARRQRRSASRMALLRRRYGRPSSAAADPGIGASSAFAAPAASGYASRCLSRPGMLRAPAPHLPQPPPRWTRSRHPDERAGRSRRAARWRLVRARPAIRRPGSRGLRSRCTSP